MDDWILKYILPIFFTLYPIGINLLGYWMMQKDKENSTKGDWRIAEWKFWLVALLGGCIGTWVGMYIFRHKTRHDNFVYGMPAIAIIEYLIIPWWRIWWN